MYPDAGTAALVPAAVPAVVTLTATCRPVPTEGVTTVTEVGVCARTAAVTPPKRTTGTAGSETGTGDHHGLPAAGRARCGTHAGHRRTSRSRPGEGPHQRDRTWRSPTGREVVADGRRVMGRGRTRIEEVVVADW